MSAHISGEHVDGATLLARAIAIAVDVALVGVACLLSLIATGFAYGIGNNVFHIPIVLDYAMLPQFAGDQFYGSLRNFTSIVWPALGSVLDEQNVRTGFLAGHVVSRGLAFAALNSLFKVAGVTSVPARLVGLCALAASGWLLGVSAVGGHGLFLDYFTHSELTWGAVLLAFSALAQGRLLLVGGLAGLTVSINLFVGAWLLAVLVGAFVFRGVDWPRPASALSALALMSVVAAPAIVWTLAALHSAGSAPDFDFAEYVRLYHPNHFLIDSASIESLLRLVLIAFMGILGTRLLANERYWRALFLGCISLLCVGALLPYLLNHRFIFDLHLLRSDGLLQFLSIAVAMAAGARVFLDDAQHWSSRALAASVVVCLATGQRDIEVLFVGSIALSLLALNAAQPSGALLPWRLQGRSPLVQVTVVLAVALLGPFAEYLAVGLFPSSAVRWALALVGISCVVYFSPKARALAVCALLACSLLVVLLLAKGRGFSDTRERSSVAEVREIASWARRSGVAGPLLVPVHGPFVEAFSSLQHEALVPLWVDWKRGAAVMWQPSYFPQWSERYREVLQLRTGDQLLEYAKSHRIPLVLIPRAVGTCGASVRPLFATRSYLVCDPGGTGLLRP